MYELERQRSIGIVYWIMREIRWLLPKWERESDEKDREKFEWGERRAFENEKVFN